MIRYSGCACRRKIVKSIALRDNSSTIDTIPMHSSMLHCIEPFHNIDVHCAKRRDHSNMIKYDNYEAIPQFCHRHMSLHIVHSDRHSHSLYPKCPISMASCIYYTYCSRMMDIQDRDVAKHFTIVSLHVIFRMVAILTFTRATVLPNVSCSCLHTRVLLKKNVPLKITRVRQLTFIVMCINVRYR